MNRAEENEFNSYVTARMDQWRRSAFLMCQNWHTADDVVSVTVAKLFRHWHTASRADNVDAYAQRVLTRSWLDERRRPWHRVEQAGTDPPDRGYTVPDGPIDRDTLAELLRSLGPRQRAVLVLRYYLDYSVEETAQILGVSTGTVKSQAARALQALRLSADAFRS